MEVCPLDLYEQVQVRIQEVSKTLTRRAGMAREDELCKAAEEGKESRVIALIEEGADVTHFDKDGYTPLMRASMSGHTAVVKLLLDSGAPWNALNPSGLSAGDLAMHHSHQKVFDLLLTAGVQAELVLGKIAKRAEGSDYLGQRVEYSEDTLVDEEGKGVMMAWERPLMEAHAKAICSGGEEDGDGPHVLNVGFGMGLVDTAIQSYKPSSHTIIEAHPDVYARMLSTGWSQKPNVKIIFGRWQDVLPQLQTYDGIFFDTYGEYYDDMKEFHQHLPKLLKPGGIYSFFNGFCGDNAFFHMVYCQIVALELAHLGLTTQFIPLPVKSCMDEKVWESVRQKYWQLDTYYLPVSEAASES